MAKKTSTAQSGELMEAGAQTENGQLTVKVDDNEIKQTDLAGVFNAAQVTQAAVCHNFPGDPWQQMAMSSAAKSSAAQPMDEMPEGGIEPQYYFVHCVQVNKQNYDGYNAAIRTCLFDRTGKIWASLSEQVARDVAELVQLCGGSEIPEGVKVKLESVKAGRGKVHKLVFAKK